MTRNVVNEVRELFAKGGSDAYFGERVSQLQHALQTARCAVLALADDELVAAALLHDIGHLLGGKLDAEIGVIDHDRSCIEWLTKNRFTPRVIALVSGHVDAKRYLVASNPGYYEKLSEASKKTLELQGGPMSPEEAAEFAKNPYLRDLLRLRSWDEQAKDPDAVTPGLEHYLDCIAMATLS